MDLKWLIGGAAALAVGGYALSRAQGAAAVTARTAGMPRYDVGLPDAIANKIDALLGRTPGTPAEKNQATVYAYAATVNSSQWPIASNALNLYAASLGPAIQYDFPAASTGVAPSSGGVFGSPVSSGGSSSSSSSGGGGLFSALGSLGASLTRVTDVKSAQAVLVTWNLATGLGGDFGMTAASDVDGLAGPRSNAAAKSFVAWLASTGGPTVSPTFGTPLYAALATYANGGSAPAQAPAPAPAPVFKLSPALLAGLTGAAAVNRGPVLPPNPVRPGAVAAPRPTTQTLLKGVKLA